MSLFLAALGLLLFSSIAPIILRRFELKRTATVVGSGVSTLACVVGLIPAGAVLGGAATMSIRLPWTIPYGSFFVEIDGLSAIFLALIFGLGALCSLYGAEYLSGHHADEGTPGEPWFFYGLLIASMAIVVTARNAMLFLMAWELMALSSFFMVILNDKSDSVRRAGIIYLVSTHLGAAFLLAFFILLGRETHSLDFEQFEALGVAGSASFRYTKPGLLFLLALVGFGSKAGFFPFHVWLPEAHPAAPSHVSALMSAVMIKTGIYGLIRTLGFLGQPEPWWAWTVIAIGFISAVGGILFASAQKDLKKLLAYSSVENIGIIALGLGIAILGLSTGSSLLVTLGGVGAVLHILNHAIYKSLLFLGAGVILDSTGTDRMALLGGLWRRIPSCSLPFLIGTLAICGLPPLNGLVSEFVIYLGSFHGGLLQSKASFIPFVFVLLGLSLCGGLSVVAFTKAFGTIFLGTARSDVIAPHHQPGPLMRWPLVMLSVMCVVAGLGGPWFVSAVIAVLGRSGCFAAAIRSTDSLALIVEPLYFVSIISCILLFLALILWFIRGRIISNRKVVNGVVTWDCGYMFPSSRMQYTPSSFTKPVAELFQAILRSKEKKPQTTTYLSRSTEYSSETPDVLLDGIYLRLNVWLNHKIANFRRFQHGRIQFYILYIIITLVALLIWHLGLNP